MDWKGQIIAPVIVGIVLALLTWLASKWTSVEVWSRQRVWAIAAIFGMLGAFFATWISSNFLLKAVITEHRLGNLGEETGLRPAEDQFFRKGNVQRVLSAGEYPICTLSSIQNTGSGTCQLYKMNDKWQVDVSGDISCKVTCFKVEIGL